MFDIPIFITCRYILFFKPLEIGEFDNSSLPVGRQQSSSSIVYPPPSPELSEILIKGLCLSAYFFFPSLLY